MTAKLDISIIKLDAWPKVDLAGWHRALVSASPLEPCGRLSHYDEPRLKILGDAFGRWLGLLALEGKGQLPTSGLRELKRSTIQLFHNRLAAVLAPYTVRKYLRDLQIVVIALDPDHECPALAEAVRYAAAVASPIGDKRPRMVPAWELYEFGQKLMTRAPLQSTRLRCLADYRDGLMIALMITRPLRLGNFSALTINRHLHRLGDTYTLAIPAREVKTRRPIEMELPIRLTPALDRYIQAYRPQLQARQGRWWRGDPGKALWISEDGTAMAAKNIAARICRRTQQHFGIAINPHLFRDIAATSIAIQDPSHVGIIQPVLGHADAATAETYYNQSRGLEAARKFQVAVGELAAIGVKGP